MARVTANRRAALKLKASPVLACDTGTVSVSLMAKSRPYATDADPAKINGGASAVSVAGTRCCHQQGHLSDRSNR